MKCCEKCKYSDLDYIFDDEAGEEYPLYTCKKGNSVDLDFECKDFKEYKPKPYKEKDTKCDKCEFLSECMNDYDYIDCTTTQDTRRHVMVGNINCNINN